MVGTFRVSLEVLMLLTGRMGMLLNNSLSEVSRTEHSSFGFIYCIVHLNKCTF